MSIYYNNLFKTIFLYYRYNLTSMPNRFNHDTQDEVGLFAHQFYPLVDIDCSPYLRFFLCTMYVPICMPNYHKPLPACREVCLAAKNGCAPIMATYGFQWPDQMNCMLLPPFGDKYQLCMDIEVILPSRDVARIFGLRGLISAEVWANIFRSIKNSVSSGLFQLVKYNIEIKSVIDNQITIS